jgi:cytochrome c biogenesis protein CcdA
MLPGYVAYYVNAGQRGKAPLSYLGYALSTATGFSSVYALVGLLPALGVSRLTERVASATLYVGALLVILGLASGFSSVFSRMPAFGSVAHRTAGASGLLVYGAGYGLASMSCSLPVFLLLVLQSAGAEGPWDVAAGFVAYGLGAAAMIVPLTLAVAYSNQVVVERFMGLLPHVKRLSAAVLVAAGLYMILTSL